MNKQDLLHKIKDLQGLTNDEKAVLINLVNTNKKYGLVWEDKPEDVEEELLTKLPVLIEDKEKFIEAKPMPKAEDLFTASPQPSPSGEGVAPNHILIEGDNLHALTALTFTHEGKIDVIYIDPPYNTGNKDFKYNDHFVDKEDSYRHSKWLSFMQKRLRLAKRLLKDTGVIFISIDDNSQAQLKLLCDELFGEQNFIAQLPTIMNLKGNQDEFGFAGTHEYSLVFVKNKLLSKLNEFNIEEEENEEWEEDEYGFFKKGANLKSTGGNAPREKRPNLFFPIFIKPNGSFYINDIDKPDSQDDYILLPITDNKEMSWRWSKKKIRDEEHNIIITGDHGKNSIYKKQRPTIGDLPSKKPKTIFYKAEYSSGNGTGLLKNIFGSKKFNNPKPLQLIIDFIHLGSIKESIILDLFAGSGTTLHATMQLNSEDGGQRQCILVTNNENKIAEEVCYERNKRVINGYTKPNGETVAGLVNNNFRYYRTGFVGREKTTKNKKELTEMATELLCIKEDIYEETAQLGDYKLNRKQVRCFTDKSRYMMIIYDEDSIETLVEVIDGMDTNEKIKIYVFAPGQYPFTEDFEDVLDKIELCALPDAIYKAYMNILPKKSKKNVVGIEEEKALDNLINFDE